MRLRLPTDEEWAACAATLSHYGCPPDTLSREALRVREGRYREVFSGSLAVLAAVDASTCIPLSLGRKEGELRADSFLPSLELGTVLYPVATRNAVALDAPRATLFLYGRDVFREHLPVGLSLGRKLVGARGEFLGFGIYNGRTLANIIDKGAYVRQFE